jgi:hypothetical protein
VNPIAAKLLREAGEAIAKAAAKAARPLLNKLARKRLDTLKSKPDTKGQA